MHTGDPVPVEAVLEAVPAPPVELDPTETASLLLELIAVLPPPPTELELTA